MLQKDEMMDMRLYLEKIEQSGADLYLEGRKTTAVELARTCCVNEEAVYMPDYVLDEAGRLMQLRYDIVRLD